MTHPKPVPGSRMPDMTLPTLGGDTRALFAAKDKQNWQLLVVYRGKHCPVCTIYLSELNEQVKVLTDLGIDILAVSADSEDRAKAQMSEVKPDFDVAYGLTLEQMKTLGLYISGPKNGVDVEGPFAEPALFAVDDLQDLRIVDFSNVPFARPDLSRIVRGLRFLREREEPVPVSGAYA
ncbi:MAG: redoxin domain-containing protein [Pseudomonadota bacterium]